MSDKKITPHQMRKGLTYVSQGPDFMRMLTGQSSNAANNDPRNPYKKPIGIEAKFQTEESDDDDDTAHDILNEREEERPTVVVLKDGKHLDERQVRNVLKNLPPGLSDAEIQKRLAEATEKLGNESNEENQDQDDDEDDDQEPVDANGKILFRRPKGSKNKAKKELTTSSSSNKKLDLEEVLLADATARVDALKKRKTGSDSSSKGTKSTDKKEDKNNNSNNSNSNNSGAAKKKKQKTTKPAASLLSFDDEE
ncbi:hypothetical protein BGX27_011197 [Mortierella sp. AM989]|nr:hypothetical protein BGX27_011197 [Mortierella sp. AM989]